MLNLAGILKSCRGKYRISATLQCSLALSLSLSLCHSTICIYVHVDFRKQYRDSQRARSERTGTWRKFECRVEIRRARQIWPRNITSLQRLRRQGFKAYWPPSASKGIWNYWRARFLRLLSLWSFDERLKELGRIVRFPLWRTREGLSTWRSLSSRRETRSIFCVAVEWHSKLRFFPFFREVSQERWIFRTTSSSSSFFFAEGRFFFSLIFSSVGFILFNWKTHFFQCFLYLFLTFLQLRRVVFLELYFGVFFFEWQVAEDRFRSDEKWWNSKLINELWLVFY